LERGERLDGVRAPDGLRACFGEAEVLDLAEDHVRSSERLLFA
jgi:hypothetical protein